MPQFNPIPHKERRKKQVKLGLFFLILAVGMFAAGWSFLVYSRDVQAGFFPVKRSQVALEEPFEVSFSSVMLPRTLEGSLALEPASPFRIEWKEQNRKLLIWPEGKWKPETDYQLRISGAKNIFLMEADGSVGFQTEKYPQVKTFLPEPESRNVMLDIEDPIIATFDRAFEKYKFKFAVDPYVELESRIDFEKREIRLIPKTALERGKRHTVIVYVRGLEEDDGAYRRIYQTSFTTKPEEPKFWEKDLTLRLEQAKEFTEARITEGKYIDINLKSQVMAIFEDAKLLDAYVVSSGRRGMDTPQGNFQIRNKFPRAWSSKYSLFMPFWMAFVPSGDYGIHELPEWPGGYKEGANHLGIPVSHGCVRLGVGPAERVYNWAEIGTPVVIHY